MRWPDTLCDAIVDRWTLGSRRMPGSALNSLAPTGFSRGQAIRVGLTSIGIHATAMPTQQHATERRRISAQIGHKTATLSVVRLLNFLLVVILATS